MDEATWLTSNDPVAMLRFLQGRASGRQFRLFATACARDLLAHKPDTDEERMRSTSGFEAAIVNAEAFADGHGTLKSYAWRVASPAPDEDVAYTALGYDEDVGVWTGPPERVVPEWIARYQTHPAHHLRDIFGSLFRSGSSEHACLGPLTFSLALAAYEQRILPVGHLDPARLAVLADALEEAGCADTHLLGHLRSSGPHVRGCFALDWVLGRS